MPETVSPISAQIGPHLPFLRRYGRALTGSQRSGDAFVRAALEALLAEPGQFDRENNPRVELFRLFHAIYAPIADGVEQAPGYDSVSDAVGESILARLPLQRREAMLLTAVEGFSVEQAAIILGRDAADVQADIDRARAEIAAEMRSRILIIEDEPVISMHLESIVEDMGHEVAGTAATRDEAVDRARRGGIDLVLADIRLADESSGIDAVKDIREMEDLPVIFITAYPERLLTGERPEPTYLITKPFEVATVVATIGQALLMHRAPATV